MWIVRAANPLERQARAAFTVMELLLVLAIMVVAAAMLVPSIKDMLDEQKLTNAGDMVRGKCAVARTHAINDGMAYRFAVALNTGRWRIAPDSDDYWSNDGNPDGDAFVESDLLPKGIRFVDGSKGSGSGSGGGDNVELSSYVRLLTYYPNGATQVYGLDGSLADSIEIRVAGEGKGSVLVIKIRGLTGAVKSEWESGN
jgi:type II secretory pathway pseudopilin PulG